MKTRTRLRVILATLLVAGLWVSLFSSRQAPNDGGASGATANESQRNHDLVRMPFPSLSEAEMASNPIRSALHRGETMRIQLANNQSWDFLVRPFKLLGPDFGVRAANGAELIGDVPEIFQGQLVLNGELDGIASIVLSGNQLVARLVDPSGEEWVISGSANAPEDMEAERLPRHDVHCSLQPDGSSRSESTSLLSPGTPLLPAMLEPRTAAVAGDNPATGVVDKYVQPIPESETYTLSLKELLLLAVLDKSATGENTPENLASVTSRYLASLANMASVYENQLGIRLLVQELVLTPDSSDYDDIPFDSDGQATLSDYRSWLQFNRRRTTYRWNAAVRWGEGLDGTTLGIAYVDSLSSTRAVGVFIPDADWAILSHEVGHVLGSNHSSGGIMNSSYSPNVQRSFFTDVSPGTTSAMEMYQASANTLAGAARLRHPEEIPFATDDVRNMEPGETISFNPLNNDRLEVRNGRSNSRLKLVEVSRVLPTEAGTVDRTGDIIEFTADADFEGTAWFSYTMRGDIGNRGEGWMHRGDVAVNVGKNSDSREIELAPGESYSLFSSNGSSTINLAPAMARLDRSLEDNSHFLLRVNDDASGTDQFRVGGQTYNVTYVDKPPLARDDHYLLTNTTETLRMFPMHNDVAVGFLGMHDIETTIGMGGTESYERFFSTTLRLENAVLETPNAGNLTLVRRNTTREGVSEFRPTGELLFRPNPQFKGKASVLYTITDAQGRQTTGRCWIYRVGTSTKLVDQHFALKWHVPTDSSLDTVWTDPAFDDSQWRNGTASFGYDINDDYDPLIVTDSESNIYNMAAGAYLRIRFSVDNPADYSNLVLRLIYDDGIVAYLNGTPILRTNAPFNSQWDTFAFTSQEANTSAFDTFDVSQYRDQLYKGENVLALHVMNHELESSDMLVQPVLEGLSEHNLVTVDSPEPDTIGIAPGTRLMVSGSTHPLPIEDENNPVEVDWIQTGNPVIAPAVLSNTEAASTEMSLPAAGTYSFKIRGRDRGMETYSEFVVESGAPTFGVPYAAEPDAGDDFTIEGFEFVLPGAVSLNEAAMNKEFSQIWEQIAGPVPAEFDPHQLTPSVVVESEGLYRFRLISETASIRSFDEIDVTVRRAPEPLSTYEQWLVANGLVPGDASGGAAADPDNDGLSNLVEFASGRNPVNSGDQLDSLLTVRQESDGIRLQYVRRQPIPTAFLTYTVETTEDLQKNWTPAKPEDFRVVDRNPPYQTVELSIPLKEEQQFYRLRIRSVE